MRLLYMIIIFSTLIGWLESTPNQCCSNGKPYIPRKGCIDNGTSWLKVKDCKAYALRPDRNSYEITFDDTLVLGDTAILPKDRFCVGNVNTENNTMILACFPEIDSKMDRLIITVCIVVSVLSLVLTLGVYFIIPRLRDLQGKCMIMLLISLLMANLFLLPVQGVTKLSYVPCYFFATSIYFWFLSTFLWMNVNCFHIWRSIVSPTFPKNEKRMFKIYNAYGWGCSLLILLIAKLAYFLPGNHLKPTWTEKSCWFSDRYSTMIYFNIPVLIILSANVILFILSAWTLRKNNNLSNNKLRSKKYKFVLYLKLFLIMGISWIFEPIETILDLELLSTVWLVTNIVNALQGLLIFLILVVFRKRVRMELAKNKGLCCRKLPGNWATIANEDCEEISEESEKLTSAVEA